MNVVINLKNTPNMKALLLTIFVFMLFAINGFAQSDTTRYQYCALVGTPRPFTIGKVTVTLDFGDEKNPWLDNRVKNEQTGKVKVFNSMVDAMNMMAKDGWHFVSGYVSTQSSQSSTVWLLRKALFTTTPKNQ